MSMKCLKSQRKKALSTILPFGHVFPLSSFIIGILGFTVMVAISLFKRDDVLL